MQINPQFGKRAAPAAGFKIALLVFLIWAAHMPRCAHAQSPCATCEVQIGVGGTYHYWAETGSLVLPVSVTWSDNRYELGVFRFTNSQLLEAPGTHRERLMALPYCGASLSRRWQLFDRDPIQGFIGFGLSAKTESDNLSVTRWDFASQLGLRFRLLGGRVVGEVTMRHWSNGGIRLPNHGQDFATLTLRANSGLFGFAEVDRYPIDPVGTLQRSLASNSTGFEEQSLP